jgi:hypothetical protein
MRSFAANAGKASCVCHEQRRRVPVPLSKDEDPAVRARAADALKKIDPEAARKAGVR